MAHSIRSTATARDSNPQATRKVAVVLSQERVVVVGQHTYHVPAGQVIRLLSISTSQPWSDGHDTEIVDAGELKLGDSVNKPGGVHVVDPNPAFNAASDAKAEEHVQANVDRTTGAQGAAVADGTTIKPAT